MALKAFRANDNKVVGSDNNRTNRTVVNLSKNENSRKLTHVPNIGGMEESNFLTFDAKKAFNFFQLAFIKAPILQHFNLKFHIQIETDISGYAIVGVWNQ